MLRYFILLDKLFFTFCKNLILKLTLVPKLRLSLLENLDWIIFGTYLLIVFLVGIWVTKKAGTDIDSYFVAGRSLPWWWLGISILATTFAADTPLAVTGITANSGIVGNWFWWSWAATYITVAVFFSKKWRKSGVLTDIEFIELRYDGNQAAILRGVKAVFFAVILNAFILGWVITAAVKIAGPFIEWHLIAPELFTSLKNIFPSFLLFKGDLNASITILFLLLLVMIYSTLGGIRGVILTDLFQFVIAMVTSILFAYLAVKYVGGIGALKSQMVEIYGATTTKQYTDFLPSFNNPLLPFQVFLIYIFVQWWVRYDSDGTGYIAQRINTAKNPEEAQKGSLLFAIGFIGLRTWPWIIVALVALVVFPLTGFENANDFVLQVQEDRELGYPMLMKLILPVGLLGLTFTSLMAAFMSTVDTHLNWGASYLVNDVYRRFVKPNANQKQLVKVSRWTVFAIAILAVIVAAQMDSIAGAWKFFINASAGLGIAQILRWFWWRANAYTEISAMLAALATTLVLTYLFPKSENPHFDTYLLLFIAIISLFIAIIFTYATPAVSNEHLKIFVEKCEPVGFWKNDTFNTLNVNSISAFKRFLHTFYIWCAAMVMSFAGLFAIGYFILQDFNLGWICLGITLISFYGLKIGIDKENENVS